MKSLLRLICQLADIYASTSQSPLNRYFFLAAELCERRYEARGRPERGGLTIVNRRLAALFFRNAL